jgi:hypothetical protein
MDPSGSAPQKELPDAHCGSQGKAIRITAVNLRRWGGNIGYNFPAVIDGRRNLDAWLNDPANAFGVSADQVEGLSFWARLANCESDPPGLYPACDDPIPLGASLFASVTDPYSTQEGCVGDDCYCVFDLPEPEPGEAPLDPAEAQCDAFGSGVGLGKEWRFFALRFDEMRQRGFGRAAPTPFPDADLRGVSISIEIGTWDLWLDDIALFRTIPAPIPPVE